MAKIDFKKDLRHLYSASAKEVLFITVPKLNFLMLDGSGDPNKSERYAEAIEALFAVSYALKFKIKKSRGGLDYAVMPLEGLWWSDDPDDFSSDDRSKWQWTAMIMQPDLVTRSLFEETLPEVQKKKKLEALKEIRFESLEEESCAQIMHLGPYSEEQTTIAQLHRAIAERACRLAGKHHEIYLSDPRKSAPEKLKTILRQPIQE